MTKAKSETKPVRPIRANRRKRIGRGNVLTAQARPGFVRRYVNDKPGRIQEFLDAGYTPVTDGQRPGDEQVGDSKLPGTTVAKHVGNGMNAYLMEIPLNFYEEDQAEKQEENDRQVEGIFKDANGNSLVENDNHIYGDGLKIKSRPTIETD